MCAWGDDGCNMVLMFAASLHMFTCVHIHATSCICIHDVPSPSCDSVCMHVMCDAAPRVEIFPGVTASPVKLPLARPPRDIQKLDQIREQLETSIGSGKKATQQQTHAQQQQQQQQQQIQTQQPQQTQGKGKKQKQNGHTAPMSSKKRRQQQ